MGKRTLAVGVNRFIDAPPRLVWALLSDTNRWDRAVGMNPSSYTYEEVKLGKAKARRMRVGHSRYRLLFPLSWVEIGEWVEGRSMWGERRFLSGMLQRAGVRYLLTPEGKGTRVEAHAYTIGSGAQLLVCLYWVAVFWLKLRRYLATVAGALARAERDDEEVPPSSAALRRIYALPPDGLVARGPGHVDGAELELLVRRAVEADVDALLLEKLCDHVRTRPDEEVQQMRPFELARLWQLDPRETLRGFLHACRAGILELRWQLNCPTCRVAADQRGRLAEVTRRVHCDECDIAFDADFADNVEAVFQPSAAIRPVERAVYCAGSPWFRPHVYALVLVPNKGERRLAADLPAGPLLVRALGRQKQTKITVARGEGLAIRVGDGGVSAEVRGGELVLENASDEAVAVQIERAGWEADIARGSVLLTMPEYLSLFATDAPSSGHDIAVGRLTVLFSDLTGSTKLYQELGDARAFALVQEHFRDTREAVGANGGAVVKTMGDAVMAVFPTPGAAFRAAIEVIWRVQREGRARGVRGLAVKIGLHEGPCLMVGANERLDFFGSTVNIAARLEAQAAGNHIVLLEDLLADPGVMRAMREYGEQLELYRDKLKGFSEEYRLASIGVAEPEPSSGAELRAAVLASEPP